MIRMGVTPSVTGECERVRPFIEDETEPHYRYFDKSRTESNRSGENALP